MWLLGTNVHPPAFSLAYSEKLIIETQKRKSEYVTEERENTELERRDLRE